MRNYNDNAVGHVTNAIRAVFMATCVFGHDYQAIDAETVVCRWCGHLCWTERTTPRYFSPLRHIKGWFEPKGEDIPF